MVADNSFLAFPSPKTGPGTDRVGLPGKRPRTSPTPPVVLDMGEASREQGFQLNGCR